MSLLGRLRDPLSLDLKSQFLAFTSNFPEWSSHSQSNPVDASPGEILSLASRFLLLPSCTSAVAETFRPLLLDLSTHRNLPVTFFPPSFEIHVPKSGPLSAIFTCGSPETAPPSRLQRVLLAYYRILMANPELPSSLNWPLEPLSRLFWTPHPDLGVRYLAIRCYAMQSGMGMAERETLENNLIGPMACTECPLEFGIDLRGRVNVIDGWLLPVIEAQRIHESRNAIAADTRDFSMGQGYNHSRPSDLRRVPPRVISVHGVLMFRPHMVDTIPSDPISSHQHYSQCVADPSIICTFEWKEGVLARAMRTGRWVVLQDADKGSTEVLGSLKALVESMCIGKWIGGRAKLAIPGRGELFPKLLGPATLGIVMLWDAMKAVGSTTTDREIGIRDLRKYCSRLEALLPSSYHPVDPVTSLTESGDAGVLVSVFPNPTLREEMFLEARDVFFGAGSLTTASRTRTTVIASIVAKHLGLTQERCDWLLFQHGSEVVNEVDSNGHTVGLRLGHIRLLARTTSDIMPPQTRPFVIHRPAATLMTRIATCVSMVEPILLTGETGTGKTSIITHLASLLHHPLISVNLSQQTESSDLLGSFKPIDARVPGSELQLQFLDLFRSTFSQKKNVKFEASTWKAVKEGKWKRAVGLWKESRRLAKDRIRSKLSEASNRPDNHEVPDSGAPRKRRRTEEAHFQESERNWSAFERDVQQFEAQYITKKGQFALGFVEGPLVRALRSGDWARWNQSPGIPTFGIFACMNPATDAGKKDLPPSVRSYFTEFEVPPPDADRETFDKAAIMDVAEFYTAVKALVASTRIADGSNRRPHFSMRTLARSLTFATEYARTFGLRRSLWEGCLMAFTMTLDVPSAELVTNLAQKHILNGIRNVRLLLAKEPAPPQSRPLEDFIKFGPFYLEKGDLHELPTDDYIMTPSVEGKLIDLARIISTRMFPVLIEGPTSSGKTSAIEFLARRTGHRFVRINNHEHTDIQEYLGTYISDPVSGKLVFQDGLLVQALRRGDWMVLDELNLAPTDVLEALNRLLDDNRELFVPETQEVIKPHPHFILFATQNPPGLYAGRKVLSRAFRGRFLEVHFDDVPQGELETILCQRCRIAPSYAQRIVAVFRELQKRRQISRVFESKQGFATLRDLFRWAGRDAVGYQELAENGYMLLAERARREDDRAVVKSVIESIMKVRIDEATLYSFDRFGNDLRGFLGFDVPSLPNIVWTKAMQRIFVLVGRAMRFKEPVLLVGETGSGKTSADLIGGLRPIRNKAAAEAETFDQVSSLLLQCGISGVPNNVSSLLSAIDQLEVSQLVDSNKVQEVRMKLQPDDSVLERLNSVLEPARIIVLAEKGGDTTEGSVVEASPCFRLIATMNPGGDYGKKELVTSSTQQPYTPLILDFIEWLSHRVSEPSLFGLRDIIAWITFSNSILDNTTTKAISDNEIFGSLPAISGYSMLALRKLKADAVLKLQEMVPINPEGSSSAIPATMGARRPVPHTYDIQAPTTRDNAMRVVRASQITKPILLEGSPGVGKTSLITYTCQYLADLFGADLPVDGGRPGEFAWKEADFLKAMQEGHWVLLDEMNLAPQSVLEGLNAVLDHRGAVYVPELGQTFSRHPSFRIFAAQNPIHQGGGRKGLPKSFVNRFTKVFVDPLTPADLLQISKHMFPNYSEDWLQRMIVYNSRLEEEISIKHSFGRNGSPWEFNLRDIFRDFLSDAPHPSISSSSARIGHFIVDRKSSFQSSSRPGVILQAHLPSLEAMGVALQQGWLVIISGPPNSGKTSLVRVMAELGGNPLQEISINHATDTTDILGSYEQVDSNFRALSLVRRTLLLSKSVWRTPGGSKSHTLLNLGPLRTAIIDPPPIELLPDLLRTALNTLDGLVDLSDHWVQEKIELQEGLRAELAAPKMAGQFTWVDGPLVSALKEGQWLLLDDANLCVLTLNERGLVDGTTPSYCPSPKLSIDHGNAQSWIEISLSPPRNQEDMRRLQAFHFLPPIQYHSDAGYVSPLEFEAMRRCLQSTSSTANPITWPPATAIVDDLSASAVVDRASLILPRDVSTLQPPSLAVLRFFPRGGPIWPRLEQSLQSIWPATSVFRLTEPMDLFMKSMTAALPLSESDYLVAQNTMLRIYELFVRTTCRDFETSSLLSNGSEDSSTGDPSHTILTCIEAFTTVTGLHGADLLRETPKYFTRELSQSQAEMQLIIDLLKYTTFLLSQSCGALDFSLLQAVTSWIREDLRLAPVHLPNISRSAEHLSRAVASSSGFGLNDIWLSWMNATSPRYYMLELEQVISDADDSGDGHKIRSQLLEHISRRYLQTKTNPFANLYVSASTDPEQSISFDTIPRIEAPKTDKISVIKELGILTHIPDGDSLARFIPYRHATWAAQSGEPSKAGIILSAFGSWLQSLWDHGDPSGPSILLQPTELSTTIQACDLYGVTLQSVSNYQKVLEQHSRLFIVTGIRDSNRIEDITALLRKTLLLLVSSFHQSFDDSTLKDLQGASCSSPSLPALQHLLRRSSHSWLALSIDRLFSGPVAHIGRDESRSMAIRNLGLGWISLSRFFMDLYIPDTPTDPAISHSSRSEFWSAELVSLSQELDLEVNLERRISGNTTNGITNYLDEQIRNVREHLNKLPHIPRAAGRDISRLREFWSEISQFMLKVISESRVNHLVDAFHTNSPGALASEHVIQDSVARFYQRMEGVYPEFDDIIQPLRSALLYFRFGLRLVAHASACREAAAIERLSHAFVAFPSVGGATSLIAADIRGDFRAVEQSPFESILVVLTAVAFEVELGIGMQSRIAAIENVYERAVRLWLIDQKKKEETDIASQSLYRTNRIAHDSKKESELEEEDFLVIFPDYEALFDADQIKESGRDHIARRVLPSDGSSPFLQLAYANFTVLMTQELRGPYNFYLDTHVPEIRRASTLVESLKHGLDALIQDWPDQMVLHHLRDRCIQILSLSAQSPVAKVLSFLEQLLLQTDDWEMYASQETTLKKHRSAITELIISWRRLELSSWPGLLRTQASTFEEGVSEWWFRLYNAIVRSPLEFVDRSPADSLDDYLDQLVPLLDGFLKLSPLGQFSLRLDLLRSFGPLLRYLTLTKSEREIEPLRRVQFIVHSTQAYYAQFVSSITSSLASQERAISADIQGFIKVASWKDANVQALKASAKRTHHRLYKVIRKYRDILRQPVKDLLRLDQVIDTETLADPSLSQPLPNTSEIDDGGLHTYMTLVDGPIHLQDLSRTYRKFDSLITSRIDVFIRSRPSHDLDHLTEHIISTAKELASVVLPSGATAERREKLWKTLLVRKRKAWSDSAKEFKRIGLATNIPSTVLLRQRNDLWLREQPSLNIESDTFEGVRNTDKYFVRLQGMLPKLRATLVEHHGDISTQELQRSIMLLESALSTSLICRTKSVYLESTILLLMRLFYQRLASYLNEYAKLKRVSQRLSSIHGSSGISAWGLTASDPVLNAEETVTRMCHAISETIHKIEEFGDLPGTSPAPASFIEGLQTLLSSTQGCQKVLRSIWTKLNETKTPVLLRGSSHTFQSNDARVELLLADEHDNLCMTQCHISKAQNLLLQWERSHPQYRLIISPLRDWLASQMSFIPCSNQQSSPSDHSSDQAIEALLVSIQSILSVIPPEDQFQIPNQDNYIKDTSYFLIRIGDLLRVDSKVALIDSLVERLAGGTLEEIKNSASRLGPIHPTIYASRRGTTYLHGKMANNGFCKPHDVEEQGDGGTEVESGDGGVGFGEGGGNENVSKEIEDESQVEGLREEGAESDRRRDEGKEDDDDAIEVGEDFQGELEDIPERGSDEERSPDDDEASPEEALGELDAGDPDIVDEKLWGDETGPRDDGKQRKGDKDYSTKPCADSEVVAKENELLEDDYTSQEKNRDETRDEGNDAESKDEAGPADEVDEDKGKIRLERMEHLWMTFCKISNTLDLPDGLEMKDDPMQQDTGEEVGDDRIGDDADLATNSPQGDDDTQLEPSPEEYQPIDEDDRWGAPKWPESRRRRDGPWVTGSCNPIYEQGEKLAAKLFQIVLLTPTLANTLRRTRQGVLEARMHPVLVRRLGITANSALDEQLERTSTEKGTGSAANVNAETGMMPSRENVPQHVTHGHQRRLGDASEDTIRHSDDILESDHTPAEQAAAGAETSQLEYLHEDDADHNMQALGPAGAEEVAKLSELRLIDDDPNGSNNVNQMDIDDQERHAPEFELLPPSLPPSEFPERGGRQDASRAIPPNEADYVELTLRQWQADGQPSEGAETLWRLICHTPLCEQLRLILEPTLATRLKGDYRSGKRLNMKKIIPYIASDYTKDKIWLRRTRPSQREYQVFLVLDDSRSMAESHSIHLAFETLALVSRALSRLEVGDIGIAKFGETVDVLHGFDNETLTDQAATQVIILEAARESRSAKSSSAGDLWQLEIIISDGLCQNHEELRAALRRAREQRVMMVFIIIDSLHSNAHIVGSEGSGTGTSQNSILSMQQVAYKNVEGRMELQMQRYLDTFPFDYYLVLRDVEALPEVLSGTIKQFFERISDVPPRDNYCLVAGSVLIRPATNTKPSCTMVLPLKLPLSSEEDIDIHTSSPLEERKGLLSGVEALSISEDERPRALPLYSRRPLSSFGPARIMLVISTLLGLVFGVSYWVFAPPCPSKALHFNGNSLRSNGTHQFKRTVVLVSIDGLRYSAFYAHQLLFADDISHRADYLDRGLTPHLLDISKKGLRAKFMKPIFPTLTFPTGLYAESHGIVANNFWDVETDSEFYYANVSCTSQPHWWNGEPMWETAGRAGLITANLMWPGPPQTLSGASPTYFVPWRDKVSLDVKLAQILEWIDLPLSKRPQLILGMARNLTDIVDVVFVSDHGMTDTSHPELVYIDEILGEEGWRAIEHEDAKDLGWPSMGFHFNPSANISHYLDVLLAAAADNSEKFSVYTPQTMPERYHFARCTRIAPIYVVPNMGYVLTKGKEGDNHGYDNNESTMHAIFVAHGPFSAVTKAVHHSRSNSRRRNWLSNPNNGWHSTSEGTYVMKGFDNVEVYNLVMKLLGTEALAAKTNGTTGFWDKYLLNRPLQDVSSGHTSSGRVPIHTDDDTLM
ncbi:midasin nuclear AAA ATPase [Russula earlei]|uniref:Midasin nuclear AAA ATPase n=1 Tax=Russula earlei TaxID=71964 RepID=A0ACC0UCR8_9AGAM|nr:midasin nuclear AAA ATPase [Russula earlei]